MGWETMNNKGKSFTWFCSGSSIFSWGCSLHSPRLQSVPVADADFSLVGEEAKSIKVPIPCKKHGASSLPYVKIMLSDIKSEHLCILHPKASSNLFHYQIIIHSNHSFFFNQLHFRPLCTTFSFVADMQKPSTLWILLSPPLSTLTKHGATLSVKASPALLFRSHHK